MLQKFHVITKRYILQSVVNVVKERITVYKGILRVVLLVEKVVINQIREAKLSIGKSYEINLVQSWIAGH